MNYCTNMKHKIVKYYISALVFNLIIPLLYILFILKPKGDGEFIYIALIPYSALIIILYLVYFDIKSHYSKWSIYLRFMFPSIVFLIIYLFIKEGFFFFLYHLLINNCFALIYLILINKK